LSPALHDARVLVSAAADLLVLAVTVRATLATEGQPDRDWRLLSLWIVAAIMISPTAWPHYLVVLFIPFVQMAAAGSHDALSWRAAATGVASYIVAPFPCAGLGCVAALSTPQVQAVARGPVWRVLDLPGFMLLAKEECAFVALLLAYIAIYWFATDTQNSAAGMGSRSSEAAPGTSGPGT